MKIITTVTLSTVLNLRILTGLILILWSDNSCEKSPHGVLYHTFFEIFGIFLLYLANYS